MKQLLLVGFGGFFGSIARYLVSKLNITWSFHNIPMGTFTVNIIGSLVIGILMGFFVKNNVQTTTNLKLLLVAGFCGGFTTFSSFTYENVTLLQQGHLFTALAYIAGSILLGILFVYFGYLISGIFQ